MHNKPFTERLFATMLGLYPPAFRAEFGEEMHEAFADAMTDAAQHGAGSLIRLMLHELAEWPGALVREHWGDVRRRKELHMTEVVSSFAGAGGGPGNGTPSLPGSWKDTWRAGLPHCLVMVFASLAIFLQNAPFMADEHGIGAFISVITTILIWGILLVTFGRTFWTAHKEGWPGWSASWFGYLFVLVAAPVIIFLQETPFATARGLDQFFFAGILPLVLTGFFYFLVRKDWIKTLLVAAPFAILLWMPVLEFVPNPIRNPLNVWMFVVIAGVSMAIVRAGDWRKGAWLIMAGSLLVGLPVAYARTYHPVYPGWTSDLATPLNLAELGLTTLFWSGMLIFGPVLLGVLRREGHPIGGQGKVGYRMMIGGFALNLAGNVLLLQTQILHRLNAGWHTVFFWMILLGFVLLFFGGVTLASAAWYSDKPANRGKVVGLSLLMLGFPITFMFPLFYSHRWTLFAPIPAGIFVQTNIPEILPYGLGLAWLLASGWFVTQISMDKTRS